MRAMDQKPDQEEEESRMLDTNIRQFIAAARQHLFALTAEDTAETATPARTIH